jgi:hypothetical protein
MKLNGWLKAKMLRTAVTFLCPYYKRLTKRTRANRSWLLVFPIRSKVKLEGGATMVIEYSGRYKNLLKWAELRESVFDAITKENDSFILEAVRGELCSAMALLCQREQELKKEADAANAYYDSIDPTEFEPMPLDRNGDIQQTINEIQQAADSTAAYRKDSER